MSRVFLLGSGFSVAAGAPLSREVLKKIFARDSKTFEVAQLETWLDRHLFHNRSHGCQQADFEEVISRLELFEHYSEPASKDRRLLEAKVNLLLKEFISLLQPDKLRDKLSCYDSFARKLRPGDLILTFNYDLVVERALERNNLGVDYQLFLPGSPLDRESTAIRFQLRIPVIKLHGSINLVFCTRCYSVREASAGALLCNQCRNPDRSLAKESSTLRPFLIAPTLFKSYSLPDLRRIWYTAYNCLSRAQELIIIGYSLPAADILTAQLLDFAHRSCPHPQKVTVVNGPHPDLTRLQSLYIQGISNTGLAFADWANLIP
ncbi:MAG: SIR2 family protein [Clostridia bacterium]|nr:SIR2 family protein [Clostridia bacterium]